MDKRFVSKLVVEIGGCKVSSNPEDELKTYALGSCVGIAILDPKTRVAALGHIALPESSVNKEKAIELPGYFADTAIPHLLENMKKLGSIKHPQYIVKLMGGASILQDESLFLIGERNVTAIKKILWEHNLSIAAMDVGGSMSRTVTVELRTGKVLISSSKGEKWSI